VEIGSPIGLSLNSIVILGDLDHLESLKSLRIYVISPNLAGALLLAEEEMKSWGMAGVGAFLSCLLLSQLMIREVLFSYVEELVLNIASEMEIVIQVCFCVVFVGIGCCKGSCSSFFSSYKL